MFNALKELFNKKETKHYKNQLIINEIIGDVKNLKPSYNYLIELANNTGDESLEPETLMIKADYIKEGVKRSFVFYYDGLFVEIMPEKHLSITDRACAYYKLDCSFLSMVIEDFLSRLALANKFKQTMVLPHIIVLSEYDKEG